MYINNQKKFRYAFGLFLAFALLFGNFSIFGLPTQAAEQAESDFILEDYVLPGEGLVGFEGDYELPDDDSPVSVMVQFRDETAAVQIAMAEVRGRYLSEKTARRIVEDDHALFQKEIAALSQKHGGFDYKIVWEYTVALNGVNIILPSDMAAEMADLRSVRMVYPDYTLELEPPPPVADPVPPVSPMLSPAMSLAENDSFTLRDPMGVAPGRATMRADDLHDEGYKGEGVVVAVIDTGIYYDHPAFEGAFLTIEEMQARGADVTDADGMQIYSDKGDDTYYFVGRVLNNSVETPNNPEEPIGESFYGHGTSVSGIIAGRDTGEAVSVLGIAPEAKLSVYSDSRGMASLLAALERIVSDKADVVNLSYGAAFSSLFNGEAMAVNNIVLANPYMVVTASGGNYHGNYTLSTPGVSSRAITAANVIVGNHVTNPAGLVYNFYPNPEQWSRTGSQGPVRTSFEIKPDIGSAGESTFSTCAPGNGFKNPALPDDYNWFGGTSAASPHIECIKQKCKIHKGNHRHQPRLRTNIQYSNTHGSRLNSGFSFWVKITLIRIIKKRCAIV